VTRFYYDDRSATLFTASLDGTVWRRKLSGVNSEFVLVGQFSAPVTAVAACPVGIGMLGRGFAAARARLLSRDGAAAYAYAGLSTGDIVRREFPDSFESAPAMHLRGHAAAVTQLAFAGDGLVPIHLVSVSADGSARQWQLETGDCINMFRTGSPLLGMELIHQGTVALLVSTSGGVIRWRTGPRGAICDKTYELHDTDDCEKGDATRLTAIPLPAKRSRRFLGMCTTPLGAMVTCSTFMKSRGLDEGISIVKQGADDCDVVCSEVHLWAPERPCEFCRDGGMPGHRCRRFVLREGTQSDSGGREDENIDRDCDGQDDDVIKSFGEFTVRDSEEAYWIYLFW
jgi:WD40 repeat protein